MPKGKVTENHKMKMGTSRVTEAVKPIVGEIEEKVGEEKILDPDLILGDEPPVVPEEVEENVEDADEDTLETYEDDEVNPFGDKWEE